ncbi:septum formation initiator family protein [bacterium]|nr:septum formation initiator family protein [bacterium]
MTRDRQKQKNIVKQKEVKPETKKNKKSSGSSSGNGVYYSFLTVVLLLCLVQITISAVLNISKIVSYKAKIIQITNTRDAAIALNDQLKDNIKNFSNVDGLEAIARNNLKMSGEDEVLVIINTPKTEEPEEPVVKPAKFKLFGKKENKD